MIRAKKSLGQNWLKSKAILEDIVKAGQVKTGDTILEVGPGQGVLTEKLLEAGAKVIAVEKDARLIEFLQTKFDKEIESNRLTLVHQDILDFDQSSCNLQSTKYKILANLPYYITGQFLRRTLESDCPPSLMVLMLQKEVAERIAAKDEKESILSISVKAYSTPKYIKTVPRKYFSPEPNVDSAILLIDHISKDFFTGLNETKFFDLVRKGFGQKRKMLRGNLGLPAIVLEKCTIPEKARAEDLSLGEWRCLAESPGMTK